MVANDILIRKLEESTQMNHSNEITDLVQKPTKKGCLGKEKVQNGLQHIAANGGCLIFLLMTHVMRVGMHKTSTLEGLQEPKDRSRIHNDLKSSKCSQISCGTQEGQAQNL